jgi:plastocyanin
MNRSRRLTLATATALAVPALLTACGSSSSSSSGGSSSSTADITIQAIDTKFDTNTFTAKAGDVTFKYVSKGSLVHTLVIEKVDGFRLQVSPGQTKTGHVTLAAGTYTVYCDIPGHRVQGMEGTLTVS